MVAAALRALRPEPLLELVNNPRSFVPAGLLCPSVDVAPKTDEGNRETWTGGCQSEGGFNVEGRLDLFDGPHNAWVAGEGFALRQGDTLLFALDGSVELEEQGELVLLDVAASWCGGPGPSCQGGLTTLDLSFTLYAEGEGLDRYEATVSGAVDTDEAPVYVEGAWRVDDRLCPTEALSGMISLRGRDRQLVELDGATTCDGCSSWTLHGEPMGSTCGAAEP